MAGKNQKQQYTHKRPQFDAFDKKASVRAALGEQYIKVIMSGGSIQSSDFIPGVSGWRLLPTGGLEFGSVPSGTFPPGSVDYQVLGGISGPGTLLGRVSSGVGMADVIALGSSIVMAGLGSLQRAALTGDVTAAQDGNATTIANDAVTNAKAANMAQSTIKGRAAAAGTGDPTDLTAAQVKTILALASSDISDFTEAAQDAVGAMIADTPTIDLTYTDSTPELKADIIQQYQHKTIFDHFADAGNTGTGEDDLYSDTVPAGQLANNGEKIDAEYGGIFVSSATATREIKFYFGGTMIFDTGALTLSLSAAWTAYVTIIRESSSVVRCMVSLQTEGAALAAYTAYTRVTGLTLANTQVLKITGEAAGVGAATNDIVAKLGTVIWHAAA